MLKRFVLGLATTIAIVNSAFAAKVTWVNETGKNVNISGVVTPDTTCPPTRVISEFRDDFIGVGKSDTRTIQDGMSICWMWHFHEEGETRPSTACRAVGGDTIHIKESDGGAAACHEPPASSTTGIHWHLVTHPTGFVSEGISTPGNVTAGSFVAKAAAGEICIDFHIADGINYPETRVVQDLCCIDTPFGKVCSNCPKCEIRDCTKRYFAQVCMPDPGEAGRKALEKCVPVAAAAAVATIICCGPGAATPVFVDALKVCLLAEGQAWAKDIHVTLREQSDCGNWRNCT